MAFPSSPTNGQTYTTNGTTYVYDSGLGVWDVQGAATNISGVTSVAGRTGVVTLTSSDVGLANVTNESKATMFSSPTFTGTTTAGTLSAGATSATSLSVSGTATIGTLSVSAINNIPIGNSTANSGAFTTLSASGAVSLTSTASITGRITKSVAGGLSTGGSGRFSIGKSSQLDMHVSSSVGGSNATTCQQYGMTFTQGNSTDTQAAIVCAENGSDGTALGFYCTDSYAAGPQLRMYILPTGHAYHSGGMGLGTSPPSTTGQLLATNSITAFYSDGRLKTKVGTIENALDKIDELAAFLYKHNDIAKGYGYTDDLVYVGLDANVVKRIQPEATALAPFDRDENGLSKSGENYLTVQYEKLVPLLVEGIKELRKEINQLKGK